MIVIAATIAGAFLGLRQAGKLRGNRRDRIQYALAFALGFSIIGLFATIIIDRMT